MKRKAGVQQFDVSMTLKGVHNYSYNKHLYLLNLPNVVIVFVLAGASLVLRVFILSLCFYCVVCVFNFFIFIINFLFQLVLAYFIPVFIVQFVCFLIFCIHVSISLCASSTISIIIIIPSLRFDHIWCCKHSLAVFAGAVLGWGRGQPPVFLPPPSPVLLLIKSWRSRRTAYRRREHDDKFQCCLLYTSPSPRDS